MPLLPGRCPCASITSENVIAYLGNRKVFLKSYSAPAAGTKEIILSRWRNRFPKSCWSICGCIIYRDAVRLSRCVGHADVFPNHRLRPNFHSQLIQPRAHQVFPEKQCQPHFEGLPGEIFLFHPLFHHHPQITLAHPHPARAFQLAKNP